MTYTNPTEWGALRCEEEKCGRFVLKADCTDPTGQVSPRDSPRAYKIFVWSYDGQELHNLADYLKLLKTGAVRAEDHAALCDKVMGLHSQAGEACAGVVGVNWLHFKIVRVETSGVRSCVA